MLLKHSAAYVIARGVPGLVGLATIIVFTRLLSPEAYGQYALVFIGSVLCNAIFYQWMSAALLRFLPESKNHESHLLSAILTGFLVVSAVCGISAGVIAFAWRGDATPLILVGVLLVWTQAWYTINQELVRSRLAPLKYGLVGMLKSLLALGIGVILVLLGFGALGALVGLLLGLLVAGSWAAWGQWVSSSEFHYDAEIVRKLLAYGLPLTASFGLATVIASTDRFMLAGLVDQATTGLYSASQGLAQQGVGVAMTVVNLAAYPLILRTLEKDGVEAARMQLRSNAVLLLGIGLPITAAFVVLAQDIAGLFLGSGFQIAGTFLMPWLAVAAFLSSIRAYYLDLPFYLGKSTRPHLLVMFTAALLNIVLNFRLIPEFGYMGAVYASVATHGIAAALSATLGRRAFALPSISGDVLRLTLATMMAAAVLYLLPTGDTILSLLGTVTVAAAVYCCGLIAFDVLGTREMLSRLYSGISNALKCTWR